MRLASTFVVSIAAGSALAQPASFTGLGTLPGWSGSRVSAVSADGATAAVDLVSNSGWQAARWSAAGGLVAIPLRSGATVSWSIAMSADGSVIIGSDDNGNWRWSASGGYQALHL